MSHYKTHSADVLIVGGGIAAMFAAMKAKEGGADVLLVDKGYAGSSGQSPYADAIAYVPPDADVNIVTDRAWRLGEYLNHRDWCDLCFSTSYDRYMDLRRMGVEFFEEEFNSIHRILPKNILAMANIKGIKSIPTMRKYMEKIGVRFQDRVMVTDLVKDDDETVIGAVGIATQKECEIHVFNAKATVLCTGATSYKPAGWPSHGLTGDGDAMAYRIGARITGKEFVDLHNNFEGTPMYSNWSDKFSKPKARPPFARIAGADNVEIVDIGTLFLNHELKVHSGNGPIIATMQDGSKLKLNGATSNGMSIHQGEGVWSVGLKCETDIKGLFAAGDSLGNRESGAVYPGGMALAGSATTGAIAGSATAEFIKDQQLSQIDDVVVSDIEKNLFQSLERKGGYDPRWVIQVLQGYMRPYFVAVVKDEQRLEATLALVEFLRDHMVPMMKSNDTHELVLALETKNMVLNAEMRLRASLYRKESRGTHYREDYPRRDDENFLVWITIQDDNGTMKLDAVPVPEEWHPDSSLSYDEKYTTKLAEF